jgi:hypothetical protein
VTSPVGTASAAAAVPFSLASGLPARVVPGRRREGRYWVTNPALPPLIAAHHKPPALLYRCENTPYVREHAACSRPQANLSSASLAQLIALPPRFTAFISGNSKDLSGLDPVISARPDDTTTPSCGAVRQKEGPVVSPATDEKSVEPRSYSRWRGSPEKSHDAGITAQHRMHQLAPGQDGNVGFIRHVRQKTVIYTKEAMNAGTCQAL